MTKLIMMVGLPGSGKTYHAHELAIETGAKVVSSDVIREEIFGDAECQSDNNKVFQIMYQRTADNLKNGIDTIYDATNISWKNRKRFLNSLRVDGIECYKHCVVVATPINECLQNCKKRSRRVPPEVVDRMYKSFQFPGEFEGWDEIEIYYPKKEYRGMVNLFDVYVKEVGFNQDSPHHEYDLDDHSSYTANNYLLTHSKFNIDEQNFATGHVAADLHDYGKLFTKQFGQDRIARYFNHHNVGAYEAMFITLNFDDFEPRFIDIIWLINNHMEPFFWDNAKDPQRVYDKYRNLWGEMMFNQIMCIHYCDMISSKEMEESEKEELLKEVLKKARIS